MRQPFHKVSGASCLDPQQLKELQDNSPGTSPAQLIRPDCYADIQDVYETIC